MKNALKNTTYLKQLNGRPYYNLSLGKKIDKMRVSLTRFATSVAIAARSMKGFVQEAIDKEIAEQE